MKTILVLTDLSDKAENAAIFAFKLAQKLTANIILYNSFEKFQALNVPEAAAWAYEDYSIAKTKSLAELKRLEDAIEVNHLSGEFKPAVSLLNEMGYDLGANVRQLVAEKKVDLVIMGTKSDDALAHLLYGSDANDVLEYAECPVLFIPENYTYEQFKTIVFANDLKDDYTAATGFLTDLARIDHSLIIVTHYGEDGTNPQDCLDTIKEHFQYPNVTFSQITGKNIEDRLKSFVSAVNADLTVMIHHRHTQFEKLIGVSKSKKMLNYHLPLLVLQG